MKKANMVYVEDDITSKINYVKLVDFASVLSELLTQYPPEAHFALETYDDYGDKSCRAVVSYERPETAQEIAKKELLKRQQYDRDRQTYERLKREFGE